MKKAPAPATTQRAFGNHETPSNFTPPTRFVGTDNPRHLRAIAALLRRPMPRESLDHEAGCSNAPELMAELRRRGLDAPCQRIRFVDRDGLICRPGVYSLTTADRRKIHAWMRVAKAAMQSAVKRYQSPKQTRSPVVRINEDGLTRERDEYTHDLSAWD